MKRKTKKLLVDAAALITITAMFILAVLFSGFIMRMGAAIESEMPSMQEHPYEIENCSADSFQE
jgi:hypothetical protein